jgi:hypothetical protein
VKRFAKYAVRGVLALIGIAIGVVLIVALREATLSTHQPVPPDSTLEIVVSASTKGGERNQILVEMVEAQLATCRLEVSSDVVGPVEVDDDGHFRAVLRPSLDETNRRQFRGCVEDWVIDHVRLNVLSMTVS